MRKLAIVALALLAAACEPAGPTKKEVVDLVPTDNEISGWARSGAMSTAENADQLYALIDGEGQPYIDNGFAKCAFQTFSGTVGGNAVELDLRVFDMADSANARAVWGPVATGTEVPWTDNPAGDEARVDEGLLFDYRVDFRDREFYVSVTIREKSQAALDIAKLFCLNVAQAIEAD
jgi:hypothetical protein